AGPTRAAASSWIVSLRARAVTSQRPVARPSDRRGARMEPARSTSPRGPSPRATDRSLGRPLQGRAAAPLCSCPCPSRPRGRRLSSPTRRGRCPSRGPRALRGGSYDRRSSSLLEAERTSQIEVGTGKNEAEELVGAEVIACARALLAEDIGQDDRRVP